MYYGDKINKCTTGDVRIMSEEHINDLYEDMERLNALYEEMMWPHDVELDFSADYENNRIIISLKDDKIKRPVL